MIVELSLLLVYNCRHRAVSSIGSLISVRSSSTWWVSFVSVWWRALRLDWTSMLLIIACVSHQQLVGGLDQIKCGLLWFLLQVHIWRHLIYWFLVHYWLVHPLRRMVDVLIAWGLRWRGRIATRSIHQRILMWEELFASPHKWPLTLA